MRYQLPEGVSSITVGSIEFRGDENGIITVPLDADPAHVRLLHDPYHHNLAPLTISAIETIIEAVDESPAAVDETPDPVDETPAAETTDKPARGKRKNG